MAEIDEIGVTDGVPTSGTGEVPTLAPVRDHLATLVAALADPATQTTLAAILAKIIAAPATEAKQDTAITALQIIDDWDESDRAKVNLIAGEAGIAAGQGNAATNSPRVVIADDDTLLSSMDARLADLVTEAQSTDDVHVSTNSDGFVVSLTTPTGALADGDVMAATQEIANFFLENGDRGVLQSVVAIDTDDQGVAFDLVFFNANTALGTEDSAPDIDDTEVLTVLGIVRVGESNASLPSYSPWVDLGANRVATRNGIGLHMEAGAATTSVWVAAITRGAPTYASGVVTIKLGFLQD